MTRPPEDRQSTGSSGARPIHGHGIVVGLNAVIISLAGEEPQALTVSVPEGSPLEGGLTTAPAEGERLLEALPTGPLDPTGDRTLELALRRWVTASTGFDLGYVEQLYTFGDRFRDPLELEGRPRVISAAYIALVRQERPGGGSSARWRPVYRFLPWEDGREGRPALIGSHIEPILTQWVASAATPGQAAERRERAAVAFGIADSPWDGERVLERYEILYELGLVGEALREKRDSQAREGRNQRVPEWASGQEMAFDHRRILATALGRIRAKIRYRPVVFELMAEAFSLFELQRAVEAMAGVRLHKQNFRRLVEQGGLVEGTRRMKQDTGGRPAELFRFRREVLLERPAPGVGFASMGR